VATGFENRNGPFAVFWLSYLDNYVST